MNKQKDLNFQQNESIFRTLIEGALTPAGLYIGMEMSIKMANKAIIKAYGKGVDIIDKLLFDLLPELKTQTIYNILNTVYQTGVAHEENEAQVNIVVNGELQASYYNYSFNPLKDNNNHVWGILHTATDVTELVFTRQKLKQSEDMLRKIADKKPLTDNEHLLKNITNASPTALWMSDETGAITYVNQTWIEWTGLNYEEHLGTGWTRAVLPEDRLRADEKFIKDIAYRRPYEVNFRLMRKDGEIRWCVATGNPQFNKDGVFIGYIGACTDVTDKTIAELQLQLKNRELHEQIKQFEFVTNFVPVQLWTAQTDGQLDYVNRTAVDFFGIPPREVVGSEWFTRVHPDDQPGCIATWTNSVETGEVYQFEFRLMDKNGDYKWHLARALPFILDDKVIKWFGTNTDIDEQKLLQRQKDDFLGIASHELKTPVTSIKAYAQVLGAMLTKEGEHKKAEMVNRMDAQINRLTNLIGDLLDVTKINSGKLQFNKTWFDFNKVIEETIDDLQYITQKHNLIKNFTETGKIYSDKDRISQVLTNLIANAIKYSPHTDRIIVSTMLEGSEAIVCVQDFGIGIPDSKKDKVFEQFYRVSGNKQHTFPGLGLGLYISSEIIKREGGRMWVNSIEGKGSTFCFALPVDGSSS
jgi:PAS domain S-box-containing protein